MPRTQPDAVTPAPRHIMQGAEASARILDAVETLFYQEGARMVGIDAVVKLAGVNKMSLYRQFGSKDELLRRYLLRRDEKFFALFEASVAQHPDDAQSALLQFFIDLQARATRPGYRGCPFVNAAAEFPDPDHAVRRQIADNKHRLLQRLIDLARQAGAKQPETLAKALAVLIEGAYTASQTYGAADAPLDALPATAQILIESYCPAQ